MKTRTPAAPNAGAPLPDFLPVPRQCARHDGWTPERQRAFIAALADTGSVSRAAAMVNMSAEGVYYLRRQPGADSFRAAWEAALDHGVARMKDIAFERAIDGYLVPVFAGGRLIGYRRKHNDRLLMFCLRHYGEDAHGKRVTINYFSTKATAGAASSAPALAGEGDHAQHGGGGSSALAEASTTTVRTIITGAAASDKDALALDAFHGVELDPIAREEIAAVLADCARRRRDVAGTVDDPAEIFFAAEQPLKEVLVYDIGYTRPRKVMQRAAPASDNVVAEDHFLEPPAALLVQPADQYRSGPEEMPWEMLDDDQGMTAIEEAVASVNAAKAIASSPSSLGEGDQPREDGAGGGAGEAGFTPAERPSSPVVIPDLIREPASKSKARRRR